MQRILDIILSTMALVFLSPLLIPISILLKLTGEGEIFFTQTRVGKKGELFKLFKFATMLKDSPRIGTGTITVRDDPRVLPVGKYLRKTKINELPQLINILLGDMSIIGPRPLTKQTFDAYNETTQKIVSASRPGLSGIGSIIFRNEEQMMRDQDDAHQFYRSTISPYKGKLEEWFWKNNNSYNYLILIFLTIWVVVTSNSKLVWYVYPSLPKPPKELRKLII